MADMVDCGEHTFTSWARQTPSPAYGYCWHNRWLDSFNPEMTGEEAANRLGMVGRITEDGLAAFNRGWDRARAAHISAQTNTSC